MNDVERLRDLVFDLYEMGDDGMTDIETFANACMEGLAEMVDVLERLAPASTPAAVEPSERETALGIAWAKKAAESEDVARTMAVALASYGAELRHGFAEWARFTSLRIEALEQQLAEGKPS